MSDYRLYCLDGAGRIQLAEWIEAASDEQAISQAREMKLDVKRCEIWRKDRLVARLNPSGRFELIES